jgi:hypothetical protein
MAILQPGLFKASLGMLLVGLVIIGGAVAAWCYWGHHLSTALKGPTEVTLEDIAKIEDPAQLPSTWVKVKLDKVVKSEIVLEKSPSNGGVSYVAEEYLIFQAGDRWMIAAVPRGFKGQELSGQIWRRNSQVARKTVGAITKELEAVHQGKLFPFEFDASEDYRTGWMLATGIIGFFAASGALFSCVSLGGIRRSYRAPRPEDYGLSSDDYPDLVVETPADAKAAVVMFIRDAGLQGEEEIEV